MCPSRVDFRSFLQFMTPLSIAWQTLSNQLQRIYNLLSMFYKLCLQNLRSRRFRSKEITSVNGVDIERVAGYKYLGFIKIFHSNIISLTLCKSFVKKIGALQKEDCGSRYLICVQFWCCHLQTCCCFYLKTSQCRLPLSSSAYWVVGREQLWRLQKGILGTSIYLFTGH